MFDDVSFSRPMIDGVFRWQMFVNGMDVPTWEPRDDAVKRGFGFNDGFQTGIRRLFKVDDKVVKMDVPGYNDVPQAFMEARVWGLLDEDDKPFFAECLGAFKAPGVDMGGDPHEVAYCVQPRADDLLPAREATDDMSRKVADLWEKYKLSDQASRQWKVRESTGLPFIHDYGISYKLEKEMTKDQFE